MAAQSDGLARAVQLHQAGDLRGAEEIYRGLLRTEPRRGPVWFALGQLCQTDQRLIEAIACFRQGVEIDASNAEGHLLLGNALLNAGRHGEAEQPFRRCLELRPDHVTALGNLGYVLGELGRPEEAKACYEKALAQRADLAELHHNLGNVLRDDCEYERALACYQQALQLKPEYAKAHINRGIALLAMGRVDEAIVDLERGIALKPDLADAHSSLGAAFAAQQRFDEALARYEHALQLKPDFAEAAWNRSLAWLLRGDYVRGWPAYEARWRCKRTTAVPKFTQPRWDGAALNGKTILLYAEQGLGDTLHFTRYAPLVKARGGKVIVNCQNALIPLLTRTPGIDGLVGWGATPPAFDVWMPLMSLPALFGTTLDTIPAKVPYVHPDPDLVAHWRAQLAPVRGLRVGIAWQGSPRHAWDRQRSVTLELFEPLARIAGVHLISLQKNFGSDQHTKFKVLSPGALLDETAGPFMDTAAIMANLDLVITVDTAIAHLAGAMGRPVWLALAFTPDWRWLLGRDDSAWYPSARLYRQNRAGEWPSVFAKMSMDLATLAQRRAPRPILLEVSPAELLDRIARLEVEVETRDDTNKRRTLAELMRVRCAALEDDTELTRLTASLKEIQRRLARIRRALERCQLRNRNSQREVELLRLFERESALRERFMREANLHFNCEQ